MKLKDIPVNSFELVKTLAKLAPPEDQPSSKPKRSAKKTARQDLGRLDVAAYLRRFGVEYNVKKSGSRTFYRLNQCLFDPNHGKNEAAIVQDDSGLITYQCFHNSCQGRRWQDAKEVISPGANLAEFCEGYEARRKRARRPPSLPPDLDQMSPWMEWDGKRERYNSARMADYLRETFGPLVCESTELGGRMYQYDQERGVWRYLPDGVVERHASEQLEDIETPTRVDSAKKTLKKRTYCRPEELEVDPMYLNLENGMFHIEEMKLYPHDKSYNSRVQLPVSYNPEARCETWLQTAQEVFADDLDRIEVLQQFFGYCLYPKILFPCAMIQVGSGANGKGTVERVISELLGEENVCFISLQRMEDKFGVAELKDKLLNCCAETAAKYLDVTAFKQVAAGDRVQAEVKYERDVVFRPIAKHLISMNELPGIKDRTDGFYRRVLVLEYKQKFEGEARDVDRADKLLEELDGIFLWALDGLKLVLANRQMIIPDSVQEARRRFRARGDVVITFADECLYRAEQFHQSAEESTLHAAPVDLWKAFKLWTEDSGLKPKLGKQKFYEQIESLYKVVKKRIGTREEYLGIGLRDDLPLFEPENVGSRPSPSSPNGS